jgi:hypothetical protein
MNPDGKSRVPPIYPMGKSLTVLLREARLETLEEAAKVAEDWAERNVMDDTSWRDIKALIAAIRALVKP